MARFEAFRGVDETLLAEILSAARPCSCAAGHELLVPHELPDQVYAVVEGRARLLHHDPGLSRPLTLALSHPGDLVGWAGLVRRQSCEWVTASTDLKLIGIPANAFYLLERESPVFRDWLDQSSTPSELIQVLKTSLRRRPHAEPDEREVMRRLLPHMQVCSFRGNTLLLIPIAVGFGIAICMNSARRFLPIISILLYSLQISPCVCYALMPVRLRVLWSRQLMFQSLLISPANTAPGRTIAMQI